MERKRLVVSLIAISIVIAVVALIVLEPWKEEMTLAEKAVIYKDDLVETGWRQLWVLNSGSLTEGTSSYCEVGMRTDDIAAFVAMYAFDSPDEAKAYYRNAADNITFESPVEPFDAGEEGTIVMHRNGNGTCAMFFYQENLFVWMELLSGGWLENEIVDDELLMDTALMLGHVQELKISAVLGA